MNEVILLIENDLWENRAGFDSWRKKLNDIFDTTVNNLDFKQNDFSLNLLLTNNDEIKELNKNFRNKNNETNVLSFPQFEAEFFESLGDDKEIFLGDIAMSYEKILEEADSFGINFFERSSHLFVHGVLHLFGFDHIYDKEAENMEDLEIKILSEFKIRNPYGC